MVQYSAAHSRVTRFCLLMACVILAGCQTGAPVKTELVKANALSQPVVIAHRGASGYRPEHTIAAYQLAIDQGAHYIEPDLVATKDGFLIARHENLLAQVQLDGQNQVERTDGTVHVVAATTNVATLVEFADRVRVKEIDGRVFGGWFSEDFTLAEIKQLKARERIPRLRPANERFNDRFAIPTWPEILQLVQTNAVQGKVVGLYPELKHPGYFAALASEKGRPVLAERLLQDLVATEFTRTDLLIVQSFEPTSLIRLHTELWPRYAAAFSSTVPLRLVQLVRGSAEKFSNPNYLAGVGEYGYGIGMPSSWVLNDPNWVQQVHEHGLALHVYTIRQEPVFRPEDSSGNKISLQNEVARLAELGVDGFFADQPDQVLSALRAAAVEQDVP